MFWYIALVISWKWNIFSKLIWIWRSDVDENDPAKGIGAPRACQTYHLFFLKAVNEAEWTISLPDKAPLIARCSGGKDSLHGAEKKTLLLGQFYVGPSSLWAPFVTIIVQLMYCLVLCMALLACICCGNSYTGTLKVNLSMNHCLFVSTLGRFQPTQCTIVHIRSTDWAAPVVVLCTAIHRQVIFAWFSIINSSLPFCFIDVTDQYWFITCDRPIPHEASSL